jgi:hypothetical protein
MAYASRTRDYAQNSPRCPQPRIYLLTAKSKIENIAEEVTGRTLSFKDLLKYA